ncbi:MAG: hypothetical protein KDB09_03935 [Acidimicrobiales bacterium]|nr:hypothetical protein [Acidimicrobiales bacterium]
MARRSISLSAGGGLFRSVERLGISRGVFGGSRGWFYVGTGLWTVRKVRTLARREPEILLREELRPGGRITIANGVATIENMPLEDRHLGRRGRKARRKAQVEGRKGRRARKRLLTQGDLRKSRRRRIRK